MNTKLQLLSLVTGAMLTGSLAIAAQGHDQVRSSTKVRATTKPTATTTMRTGGSTEIRREAVRTRRNIVVRNGTVRNRSNVYVSGPRYRYSYPHRYYGYGDGYPYYSYGPSVSFGFGFPYYSYGGYHYDYSSGYYYSQPGYSTYANGSVVVAVQTRLARAGYYHGVIDGAMGPRTRYAIQAYERDYGLRVDGTISGPLLRNMGLLY